MTAVNSLPAPAFELDIRRFDHGGPYPATAHPGFTAVGIPASLLRFAALHGYDNVREPRLPPELQDINPTGRMWQRIDGESTRADFPVSS